MGRGAAAVLARLHAEGRLDGVAAVGGSGNSSIAAQAMRDLPVGVPKLIVSTVASGDTRPYVGATDVTMMYSVVDIAGINQISARILANAAGAIAGMATARGARGAPASARWSGRRCSASPRRASRARASAWRSSATRCSSSTPPAPAGSPSRRWPPAASWSARSTSRRPSWPTSSSAACCRPGPDRLEAVGRAGIPQVVSLGALDMVNFGPRDTVPEQLRGPQPLRAQPDDHADAHDARGDGRARAPDRRASSTAPTGRRCSSCRCAASRRSTSRASRSTTPRPTRRCSPRCARASTAAKVEVHEVDADVNDPAFATAMADRLHELIQEAR